MQKFKWVVEFTVDKTWVEDGFNLDDERAKSMIENDLQWADGSETKARVLKSPDVKSIGKVQGYCKYSCDRCEYKPKCSGK